jgi:glucosamine-6-phosphate deaminase
MGIGSILNAKKIIVIAYGEKKRKAIWNLLKGQKNSEWPITALLEHHDVTIIVDRQALPITI